MEALEIMGERTIDLIFLDIQMPDITGIQLLKSLPHRPLVIFTTAFSNYAKEGYDLDVIDYLLKPYSFERFIKAVNKVREYLDLREIAQTQGSPKENQVLPQYLFVRADYKLVKINFNEILYIEGLKDYVKIYTGDRPIITQMSMKALEEKLPANDFLRVHRSYIVAFNKIEFIQKNMLTIGKKEIPISEHYHDQLYKRINYEKPSE
jgi:DNA-binding LytR/AlgR family response regulator